MAPDVAAEAVAGEQRVAAEQGVARPLEVHALRQRQSVETVVPPSFSKWGVSP